MTRRCPYGKPSVGNPVDTCNDELLCDKCSRPYLQAHSAWHDTRNDIMWSLVAFCLLLLIIAAVAAFRSL